MKSPQPRGQLPITSYQLLVLCLAALACSVLSPAGTRLITTAVPVTEARIASPTAPTAGAEMAVLAPENLSAGDPYAPGLGNSGYDVRHYTLRVALRPGVREVEAATLIELESTQAGLRQISLDFIGFQIDSVTVDGAPAEFGRYEQKLLVNLPQGLEAGAPATLAVIYHGQPDQEPSVYVPFVSHLGLHFESDHLYAVSEPDGARYWFPANDHPRDKATFRFEVAVPPGLTGVANGALIETQTGTPAAFADGQPGDVYIWEHNFPMATYQATVAVGPYMRVDDNSPGGVPLRHYLFEEDRARFEPYRATIGEMVDWLAEQFGPYPFEAFGTVLVGNLGGALETQTMVVMDRDGLSDTILVHELAHQWFGDWVSLDSWGEIWRSEGFASYLAALWLERGDPAALAERLAPAIERGPRSPFPMRNPPPNQLFGSAVYEEGALLAGDLRQTMGDEAFYAGLRAYFAQYGGATASDAEFQAVLEAAAGKSLEAVFVKWLE